MKEKEKEKVIKKTIDYIKENWEKIVNDMIDRELSQDKLKALASILMGKWNAYIKYVNDISDDWVADDVKIDECKLDYFSDSIDCWMRLPNSKKFEVEVYGESIEKMAKREFEQYDKYYNMIYAFYQNRRETHDRIKLLELTNESLQKEIREKDEKIKELESKIKELENNLKVQETYLNEYKEALEKIAEALPPQFVDYDP